VFLSSRRNLLSVFLFAVSLGCGAPASAADVQIAVAANFTEPAREIAAAFAKASGHKPVLSFGSSGAFYTQIKQGAPFEILLSADVDRPRKAEQDGLAVPGSRFTYAVGKLVLYSAAPGFVDGRGAILRTRTFQKLAIADPVAAPYGDAAIETLKRLGIYEAVAPRIVQGSSIAQAYQFVSTGAAELGFVAQSQMVNTPGGSRWNVPASLHKPIEQQAVLLFTGKANPAATAFLKYLKGPTAKAIIKRYGYDVR